MTTNNPRIQVTLDENIHGLLAKLAKKQDMSKSSLAASLISEALELHEDQELSNFADKRYKNTKKWLNHKDVWSDV